MEPQAPEVESLGAQPLGGGREMGPGEGQSAKCFWEGTFVPLPCILQDGG